MRRLTPLLRLRRDTAKVRRRTRSCGQWNGQLIVQHTKGAVELWRRVHSTRRRRTRLAELVEIKAGKKNPVDSLLGKSVLAARANGSS